MEEVRYGFMLDGELLHVENAPLGHQLVEVRGTASALDRAAPSYPWVTPVATHFIRVWLGLKDETLHSLLIPRLDVSRLVGVRPVVIIRKFMDSILHVEYHEALMPKLLSPCLVTTVTPDPLHGRYVYTSTNKHLEVGNTYYGKTGGDYCSYSILKCIWDLNCDRYLLIELIDREIKEELVGSYPSSQ